MPRRPDLFKPPPDRSYSKSQVNKAGDLARAFRAAPVDPDDQFKGFDVDELGNALEAITWWRGEHAKPLSRTAVSLRHHVEKEDALVGGRIDVTQRLKRRPTILDKLDREPGMNLARMGDIGGVRARMPSIGHVYAVSRRLKKNWTVVRTSDYIAAPKASGYRAIHHVIKRSGYLIEVQLRTERQDAWANQLEEDGRNLGIPFKFGQGDEKYHDYFRAVSQVFAYLDADERIPDEAIDELRRTTDQVRDLMDR